MALDSSRPSRFKTVKCFQIHRQVLSELPSSVVRTSVKCFQILQLTSNVADLLKLHRKGRLKVGMDADLVVLDENLAIRHVMAGGEWHVRNGQIARRGMYEQT